MVLEKEMSLGPMGVGMTGAVAPPQAMGQQEMHMVECITSQMGRSLLAGVQALAPALTDGRRGGVPGGRA